MTCVKDEVVDNSIKNGQIVQIQGSNSLHDSDKYDFLTPSSSHHLHDSSIVNFEVQLVDSPIRSLRQDRSIISAESKLFLTKKQNR